MKIKPDWNESLHSLRAREIEMIFKSVPNKLFASGLEIGAGDGFQTTLLARWATHLTCTEYEPSWLISKRSDYNIAYLTCDAEEVGTQFDPQRFDLIFSSNVLEHLPRPDRALNGMRHILKDTGIMIHVMPTPFWKLILLALFYPNLLTTAVERLTDPDFYRRKFRRSASRREGPEPCNNPKVSGWRSKMFLPVTHGASSSHLQEFVAFRQKRWRSEFENAGFEFIRISRGPASSGYRLGLNLLRRIAERFGPATEYIYICKKRGQSPEAERFFRQT